MCKSLFKEAQITLLAQSKTAAPVISELLSMAARRWANSLLLCAQIILTRTVGWVLNSIHSAPLEP